MRPHPSSVPNHPCRPEEALAVAEQLRREAVAAFWRHVGAALSRAAAQAWHAGMRWVQGLPQR